MREHYSDAAPFLMQVEDCFTIKHHRVVVTGRILRGHIKVDDDVQLVGFLPQPLQVNVAGVEMPQFPSVEALLAYHESHACGLLFRDLDCSQVAHGQVVAAPGTIGQHKKFTARIEIAATEDAVRQQPYASTYRNYLHMWGTDVFATLWLPEGKQTITPGDQFETSIELNEPVAVETGVEFTIGRFMGTGTVISIED
jgi:elongation factor Tu